MPSEFAWTLDSLKRIWPETILVGGILALILADLKSKSHKWMLVVIACLVCMAAFAFTVWDYTQHATDRVPTQALFKGSAAFDGFMLFFRFLFLTMAIVTCLFSWPVIKKWSAGHGEYLALLLACTFGMIVMAQANDLLMMYLALEFVSVTSYIMSGLLQRDRKSSEASLKYIIYGAAASGVMIYGMTYLYGLTGSLNILDIGTILRNKGTEIQPTMKLITSVLISGGFAYKIAAVPFHMWCPDVYEGSPTPVTAFFSIGPKIAGFAMFVRFLKGVFPDGSGGDFEWHIVIALLALLTMAVGNLTALHQTNLKRLMAYSGISHAGYMLLAFLSFTDENVASLLFYASVYFVMNLGAFLVVIVLEEKYRVTTIEQCSGLGWIAPGLCSAMTIFLLSLVGVPPFAGFIGKLMIFGYLVKGGGTLQIGMAVIGVLFSVVSLVYYAKILRAMFLEKPAESFAFERPSWLLNGLLWIMAFLTVGLGLWWDWLYAFTTRAAKDILGRIS